MLNFLQGKLKRLATDQHQIEVLFKSYLNLFVRLITRGLSYLLVFAIIYFFGAEEFGQWTLVSTIFLFLQLISGLGLKISFVRFFSDFEKGNSNLFNLYQKSCILMLGSSIVVTAILYFTAELIALGYNKPYLADYLKIISFCFLPLNFIDLHSGFYRGIREIGKHSFLENFSKPFVFLLLILAGRYFVMDFPALFQYYVISTFIIAVISFLMVFKTFRTLKDKLKGSEVVSYSEIVKVSTPMFLTSSLNTVNRWADVLILGIYCGDLLIGAYGLAIRLSNVVTVPLQSVNSIAASKFRQLYTSKQLEALKKVVLQSSRLIFRLGIIPSLVLMFGGEWVIQLFEPKYAMAFWSLFVLTFSQLINITTGSVGQLLNMTDGHLKLLKVAVLSTLINLVLNLSLIPFYGIVGAAIATGIALIFNNVFSVFLVKKRLGFFPMYIPGKAM